MKTLGYVLLIAVAAVSPSTIGMADDRPPNVLLIVADDLGYGELGCQGNPQIPTPHIDSLATNGIRFTSGYVSCPVCSPTRAGLMTGRYQQRFGHEFNPGTRRESGAVGLPLEEKTLADHLQAAGYATGICGKWHLGYRQQYHPQERGFDEFFGFLGGAHDYRKAASAAKSDQGNPIMRGTKPVDNVTYTTTMFGREAAKFIERHKQRPWFVYLPFNAVHAPLQPPPHDRRDFGSLKNEKRLAFAAMLAAMDDAVGEVLATLAQHDLEENTLIFFLSDNGGPTDTTTSRNNPLSGEKGQVLEGGIRIPFLVQWKGHLPAGKVDDRPVISLDIVPTALAVAGRPVADAESIDGVNLLPYLTGERSEAPHAELFWRYGQKRAVRMGEWKLTDQGSGVKLYNLAEDVGERNDLSQKHPEKSRQLEAAYARWNARNIPARWATRGGLLPPSDGDNGHSDEPADTAGGQEEQARR